MNEKQLNNLKQIGFLFIKLAIVFGAFYFIYRTLLFNEKLDLITLKKAFIENQILRPSTVFLLLLLSLLNWLIEVGKWKLLVSSIKKITYRLALEQTLGAHTAALFTPNKIGEFGAKALYFKSAFRKHILLLTFIGNGFQFLVTILFGLIGCGFLITYYHIPLALKQYVSYAIVLLMLCYFLILIFKQYTDKIKGFKIFKILHYLKSLPLKFQLKVFTASVARYLVFSHQFYFLIVLFNLPVDYITAISLITATYLLSSLIPMLFFLDVVVKGSVAVFLFRIVGVEEITILCITSIMWFFNFALPSLFGSYFILNFNQHKQVSLD